MLESQGSSSLNGTETGRWDEREGTHHPIPAVQTFMGRVSLGHISLSCLWGQSSSRSRSSTAERAQGRWHTRLHQPGKGTREPGQSVPAQARVLSAPLKENPEAPSPLQPVRTCKEALSVDQETCSHQTPAPWASRSWTHYSPRADRVHKQLLPVPMARRWRAHADPGSIREQPLGQGLHCLDSQSGPAQARPRSLLSWGVSP